MQGSLHRVWPLALWAAIVASTACPGPAKDKKEPGGDTPESPVCSGLCRVSLVAGTPGGQGAIDAVGEEARLSVPSAIIRWGDRLLFADKENGALRTFDPASGAVSMFAGSTGFQDPAHLDGASGQATFYAPVALAQLGDDLFVADEDPIGSRLRRVGSDGQVYTVLDSTTGKPWTPPLGHIVGLASDGEALYVAGMRSVWRYDPTNSGFTYVAGQGDGLPWYSDGVGAEVMFLGLTGLTSDGAGTLYATDGCVVRRITPADQTVSTAAGLAIYDICITTFADETGSGASFGNLEGITFYDGALFVTEQVPMHTVAGDSKHIVAPSFGRIRRIDVLDGEQNGQVTTVAGALVYWGSAGETDGDGLDTRLFMPSGIAAAEDLVYFGTWSAIRSFSKVSGQVNTVAGRRLLSSLPMVRQLTFDGTDLFSYRAQDGSLLRIDPVSGAADTFIAWDQNFFPFQSCSALVAQEGQEGLIFLVAEDLLTSSPDPDWPDALYSYDRSTGELNAIALALPKVDDMVTDRAKLYVLSHSADMIHNIQAIDPSDSSQTLLANGIHLSTFAPRLVSAAGALYLADGPVIYRLDGSQLVPAFGRPGEPGCDDGPTDQARLHKLAGIAADEERLFAFDAGCHTLRSIDLATGQVTTLAGSPERLTFAPGDGADAGLNDVSYLALDPATQTLYGVDRREGIILKVTAPSAAAAQ